MSSPVLFEEHQQFRKLWLWGPLIGLDIFFLTVAYQHFVNHCELVNKPLSGFGLILGMVALAAVTALFYFSKLDTIIRHEGIYVRFYPFHRKFKYFKWDQLQKCFVRHYKPIGEYGGWGLRVGFGNNAYNVAGNKGLQLLFQSSSKLLIGTQKPQELDRVLKRLGQDRS